MANTNVKQTVFEDEDDEPTVRMSNPLLAYQQQQAKDRQRFLDRRFGFMLVVVSGLFFWGVVLYFFAK